MDINESGRQLYNETRRILRNAMNEKQLVLFIGAGVSVNSGMPLWGSAIKTIAERLPLGASDDNDFLKIPQYYYNSRGKKEYNQLMREIFRYGEPLETNCIHKKVLDFQTNTIITTNYDNLIEKAAEENGQFIQVFSRDVDLPYKKSGKELIKMHGDFEHDNFVLKEDDYLYYASNFKLIETYIKSIIGSKVVLFIGYSLNDPDVKQIISWVKETLDQDFQRAYLILTGKKSSQIEKEYYLNLGVNIIYATELLSVNEEDLQNHQQQLMDVLDFFLQKDNLTETERFYEDCILLDELKYVYGKYLKRILWRYSILNDHYVIHYKDRNDSNTETQKIILDALWNEFSEDISKSSPVSKTKRIASVFRKSPYECITKIEGGKHNQVEIDKTFNTDLEKKIREFDFKGLLEIQAVNERKLSSLYPELYLEQAYISFLLNKPNLAYNHLKNASAAFYKKRLYVWYYISEFNRKHIGKICLNPWYGISGQEMESIQKEVESIDLDRILESIPNYDYDKYSFLKELSSFEITYTAFQNVFSDSLKASEQANTKYTIFGGMPAYESLKEQVQDFSRYISLNYLMVDKYSEVISVFTLYARTILSSVTTANIGEELLGEYSKNIHQEELTSFDLYVLLKYFTASKLEKLFSEYNVDDLPLDENAIEYIHTISDSFCNYASLGITTFMNPDIFWDYLEVVSHISFDRSIASKILCRLNDEVNEIDIRTHNKAIHRFIVKLDDATILEEKIIVKKLTEYLQKIIQLAISDKNLCISFQSIIIDLAYVIKQAGLPYDNHIQISELLAQKQNLSTLVMLYEQVGEASQKAIKGYFEEWNCTQPSSDYSLYCQAVLAHIIDVNEEIEENILSWLEEKQKVDDSSHVQVFLKHDDLETVIGEMTNLFLNDSIINVSRYKTIALEKADGIAKWLIDMDNFNYEDFNLEWLFLCKGKLLTSIASHATAKKEITKIFKDKYLNNSVDPKVIEIILKYFI